MLIKILYLSPLVSGNVYYSSSNSAKVCIPTDLTHITEEPPYGSVNLYLSRIPSPLQTGSVVVVLRLD